MKRKSVDPDRIFGGRLPIWPFANPSQLSPKLWPPEDPYFHDPFFVFIFDDSEDPNDPDPNDLRGVKRAPRRFVDWQTFFKFERCNFRPNKRIDRKLSSVVMLLPGSRGPAPGLPADGVQSLASRNLIRHVNFGIPSGQAIARRMGLPVLTPPQLDMLTPFGMEKSTPLWFYILKEAELMEDGLRLGPVGGRIVGEVFIGLLKADTLPIWPFGRTGHRRCRLRRPESFI